MTAEQIRVILRARWIGCSRPFFGLYHTASFSYSIILPFCLFAFSAPSVVPFLSKKLLE